MWGRIFWFMLFAGAFLVASGGDAVCQGSPPNRNADQRRQEPPKIDQRGTNEAPVIVKVLPAEDAEEKTKQEAAERAAKNQFDTNTLYLSAATVVVAFLQFVAIGIQAAFLWLAFKAAKDAADAAQRQASVMMAVESPMPLIVGFKFAQYSQIPGETVVVDPLPPGAIQPNCRILFCIENKGRSPLRMIELCIEKFAGTSLPYEPVYVHVIPWGLVLEKGPIWIRAAEEQVVITPEDIGAALAAYEDDGAFWVFGYFAYRNLLNERVEHKFLVRWDLANGFVAENRPRYT
jgi:hypothetical protein